MWRGARPAISSPRRLMEPRRGLRIPAMVIIRVVLPAPFGPSRQVMSPSAAAEAHPLERLDVAVGGRDVAHLEERLAHERFAPPGRRRPRCRRLPSLEPPSSELLRASEIGFLHGLVLLDLGRRPLRDLAPEVEGRNPVGNPHHELHDVLDEEDGDPLLLVQPPQALVELSRTSSRFMPAAGSSRSSSFGRAARARASSRRRCSPNARLPASSSRLSASPENSSCSSTDARRPRLPESQRAKKPSARTDSSPFWATHRFCQTVRSVKRRMFWKVRAMPDRRATCGGLLVISAPSNATASRGDRKHPADEVDGRALAGAVGPDEAEDLALLHGDVEAVHGTHASEVLGEGTQLKH